MALDKSTLKKFGCFFASAFSVVGAIGGFATCAYNGAWFIAVCTLVVTGCAVPTVVKMVKELIS